MCCGLPAAQAWALAKPKQNCGMDGCPPGWTCALQEECMPSSSYNGHKHVQQSGRDVHVLPLFSVYRKKKPSKLNLLFKETNVAGK